MKWYIYINKICFNKKLFQKGLWHNRSTSRGYVGGVQISFHKFGKFGEFENIFTKVNIIF